MGETEWEAHHDFIQWLFPNNEPSMVIASAPLVTRATRLMFINDTGLTNRLITAYERFLKHIGMAYKNGKVIVVDQGRVYKRVISRDHNQLRITRVLRSVRLLGQSQLADALYKTLLTFDGINEITLEYWKDAMNFRITF